MRTLARLVSLATGALAAARAPQAPMPSKAARKIAATSSGTHGRSTFSAQLLQGRVSGSAPLAQAPAIVLQGPPVAIATTTSAAGSVRVLPPRVKSHGIKSLLLSASAMTFLTGWDGSDAVTLLSQLVFGVGAAWVIWTCTWGKSHSVKQLAARELAAQKQVVDDAISELESEELQAEYFSENPRKALEVVQAMKTEAEALQLKQKEDEKEMEALKKTAREVLVEMEQTRFGDGAPSYYELNPAVVRMLTDFIGTCDAVLEDAGRSALGNLDDLLENEIPRLLKEIDGLVKLREAELERLRTAEERRNVLEDKIQGLLGKGVRLSHGMAERARVAANLVQGVRGLQDRVDHARAWSELSLTERLGRFFPSGTSMGANFLRELQDRRREALRAVAMREAQPAGASGVQARQLSAQGGGS